MKFGKTLKSLKYYETDYLQNIINDFHDQTNAIFKGNNLLYNYQFGFRSNDSTNLCLSFLTDKFLKSVDVGVC